MNWKSLPRLSCDRNTSNDQYTQETPISRYAKEVSKLEADHGKIAKPRRTHQKSRSELIFYAENIQTYK